MIRTVSMVMHFAKTAGIILTAVSLCVLLGLFTACSALSPDNAGGHFFVPVESAAEDTLHNPNDVSEADPLILELDEEAIDLLIPAPDEGTKDIVMDIENRITDPENALVEEWMKNMTIAEKIGQLIMCRIPGGTVYEMNSETEHLITDCHIGGFILFSENVNSIAQVVSLTENLQALSTVPLFIATDEEGGRVSRVGKLYDEKIPSAYKIGQTNDLQQAYDMGKIIGERLIDLGINMDFAPVADIWSNTQNTVIGDRAFSSEAEPAADRVEAAVKGFKDAGVFSVLKHFPGHGDTVEDSHVQMAVYPYAKERFESFEALPFLRGMAAGADGVMVGHIATPLIQKENTVLDWMTPWLQSQMLPAVFSDLWQQDILRGEMGFDGLIITDALEMKALTNTFSNEQITIGAFMAGADVLLIPPDVEGAYNALLNAYEQGVITDERLNQSVQRVLKAKAKLKIG